MEQARRHAAQPAAHCIILAASLPNALALSRLREYLLVLPARAGGLAAEQSMQGTGCRYRRKTGGPRPMKMSNTITLQRYNNPK
jgi:hypothetical protein